MWKILFPKKLFEDLNEFLFSIAPYENGCFLLANSYTTRGGKNVIIVTDIIKPREDSWNRSGEDMLEPSSSFTNDSVVMADQGNSSLLFIHTHPSSLHPPSFSSIDEKSNKRLFLNLTQILPGKPLGSLVFSKAGVSGVVFDNGKIKPVSAIGICGNVISNMHYSRSNKNVAPAESFDRQARAIGEHRQKKLREMAVAIVGVGGTGSAVAVQLARMGIGKLLLIDKDGVDKTNLSRLYGAKESDVGKPKVVVLEKHITSFSKTKIATLKADVTTTDIIADLLDADVIFACTDNLTSRSILNDISIQYYIPLIDVGCRIHLNDDRSINQAVVKVQVATPDTACLWCSGTLDGKIILQESFSDEEKKKLAAEGYYEGVEKQPSIISMTTMAASIAVNKLLNLLGVFGIEYNSRTQIELKTGFMIDDTPAVKSNCVCQKRRGLANKRKIIN